MHQRITVDTDDIGNRDFNDWIDSTEELGEWLDQHPGATAVITRWGLELHSKDADDLMDLEQWSPPGGTSAAVEDFGVSGSKDTGYVASWAFC